jgi:hypothetical protein
LVKKLPQNWKFCRKLIKKLPKNWKSLLKCDKNNSLKQDWVSIDRKLVKKLSKL